MARSSPLEEALSDPFLSEFQIYGYPGFFSLSAHHLSRPININTQLRLAAKFVHAAKNIGLIGEKRPLLVVGAGAAGVAAAIAADRLNIAVRLRETMNEPFSLQASCPTRWLHPHQYDWPQSWFVESKFPLSVDRDLIPLEWEPGYAADVASQWRAQLNESIRNSHDFRVWLNAPHLKEGLKFTELGEACDTDVEKSQPFHFAAYLFCRGFAQENVRVGTYTGYSFWKEDPFERPSAGLDAGVSLKVFISGAGDGGMQDLCRFVFGSARPIELIQAIADEMSKDEITKLAWDNYCRKLLEFAPDDHSGPRVGGAKDPCREFIASLEPEVVARLHTRLEPDIIFDFSSGSIQLICGNDHLPTGFALNRTIVILMERFLAERFREHKPLILLAVKLTEISGINGHACANNAKACHGVEHVCKIGGQSAEFNVLVVRHGLDVELRSVERAAEKPLVAHN